MSKAEALRFLQQAKDDDELVEKVRAAVVGGGDSERVSLPLVATDFGYDFSDEELKEASKDLLERELSEAEGMEIDDEELAQVAGGVGKHYECASTYSDGENCWTDDQCDRVLNYYKGLHPCKYTYNPRESCYFLERPIGG